MSSTAKIDTENISHSPIAGMRATFDTHRLKKSSSRCWMLVPSRFSTVFFGIFYLVGAGVAARGVYAGQWQLIAFGIVFVVFPFLFSRMIKSVKFDADLEQVSIKKVQPLSFAQVRALQIVPIGGMYQLNLIDETSRRTMLIPCGQGKHLRQIAAELADYLGGVTILDRELQVVPHSPGTELQTENIAWAPIAPGGTNMRTHKLVKKANGQYRFCVSFGFFTSLFLLPFMLGGIFGSCFAVYQFINQNWATGGFFLVWSAIFGAPLWWYLYMLKNQPIFDLASGEFRKGRQAANTIPLADISGLQILTEEITGAKGGSYSSYELNLIMKDDNRINIVDHGDYGQLKKDAETLAEALNVKLLCAR